MRVARPKAAAKVGNANSRTRRPSRTCHAGSSPVDSRVTSSGESRGVESSAATQRCDASFAGSRSVGTLGVYVPVARSAMVRYHPGPVGP